MTTAKDKIRWNLHDILDFFENIIYSNSKSDSYRFLATAYYASFFLLFGPLCLILVLVARSLSKQTSKIFNVFGLYLMVLGIQVPMLGTGLVSASIFTTLENIFSYDFFTGCLIWYLFSTIFFGGVYLGAEGLSYMKKYFKQTKQAKDELERLELERQELNETQRMVADKKIAEPIQPRKDLIQLGTVMRYEQFPNFSGVENYRGWLRFNQDLLDRHMFILGTTGAGKTEYILRLCWEVLANTNRNLYIVDGKGESKFGEIIASMCYQLRGYQVPIFKLGHLHPGAVYNGFSGSPNSIFNRLAYMVGVMDASSSEGQYYTEINKRLLQLACLSGVDGERIMRAGNIDAPRSFEDVLNRLDYSWLKSTYQDLPLAMRGIEMAKEEKVLFGLYNRLYNLANSFGGIINPKGFSLENTKCAVFSLKTNSAGIEAQSLVEFLNTDIQDFIANRISQPSFMVMDEFGSFANKNIVNILSQSRSSKLGVALATQTITSLGDLTMQGKILENCNTHVMMRTLNGEEIARFAGTRVGAELGIQLKEGVETGVQTARNQYQMRVNPQELKELNPGEAIFANSGRTAKIKVARVEGVKITPDAIASNAYSKEDGEFKQVQIKSVPVTNRWEGLE